MLPALTAVARRPRGRSAQGVAGAAGAAGALLLAVAVVMAARGAGPSSVPVPLTTAEVLAPNTWAMSVPVSWFAAPIAGLHRGDRVDVLALRPGDRASATAVAFDLLVVSADDRAVVFGTGADDATALGIARASGQLLIPLLRSSR